MSNCHPACHGFVFAEVAHWGIAVPGVVVGNDMSFYYRLRVYRRRLFPSLEVDQNQRVVKGDAEVLEGQMAEHHIVEAELVCGIEEVDSILGKVVEILVELELEDIAVWQH